MNTHPTTDTLREQNLIQIFGPEVSAHVQVRPSIDIQAFDVSNLHIRIVIKALKDMGAYTILSDITAVDWQASQPRFSIFYHLYAISNHAYIRLVVPCAESVDSIADIYAAANWHEREVFDMFGIHFNKHPNLKRILMWDAYPYNPLRKEFPLSGIETELPGEDTEATVRPKVMAAPMMGGPFYGPSTKTISTQEPSGKDQSWSESKPKPKDLRI